MSIFSADNVTIEQMYTLDIVPLRYPPIPEVFRQVRMIINHISQLPVEILESTTGFLKELQPLIKGTCIDNIRVMYWLFDDALKINIILRNISEQITLKLRPRI